MSHQGTSSWARGQGVGAFRAAILLTPPGGGLLFQTMLTAQSGGDRKALSVNAARTAVDSRGKERPAPYLTLCAKPISDGRYVKT